MTEMEKLVDKMLTTEFQRYATADLNRPLGGENTVLDGVSNTDGITRDRNVSFISSS